MDVDEKLSRRITRALTRLDIGVSSVEISNYSERFFGNHTAMVQTDEGLIDVIFDRQYEIDLRDSNISPGLVPEMKRILNEEWMADARAGV